MNERALFDAALEISDAAARKAFLDQSCAGQPQLRARLDALLASHAAAGDFLATPVTAIDGPATGNIEADKTVGYAAASPEGHGVTLGLLAPSTKPGSLGRLEHYEVEEILGHGAFGIVLKAFDEKLHRRVAIKVLAPELAATSPPRKRFLREARAAAGIRHENVVAVHDVAESPLPYLVMEYIPGITLERALQDHGPLDADDVLRLGQQIACGLAAAHAQGLIHRDIKPSNILLENGLSGRVKITDFGLARAADDASLTQSGIIAGTPMYMSPEQAQSGQIDQRSDLFSLGSVLYVMLSGRPPFRASTTLAVLKRVVEDTPRPIREIIADTPDWLCAIIAKLQAKNPEDRFATAREIAELLGKCLADLQANRPVELPAGIQLEEEKTVVTATPVNRLTASESSSPHNHAPSRSHTTARRVWPTIAALIALLGLGVTEATGVTQLTSTVIRLTTGSGTLVIETDDPSVKVTIDGEEVSIQGAGVEQLTLKPGQYKIAAVKDGKAVSQELVTITRGGKLAVRVSLEGIARVETSVSRDPQGSALADPNRAAAEWALSMGGRLTIRVSNKEGEIRSMNELPIQSFQLTHVILDHNEKVKDAGLSQLTGLKNLTYLRLDGSPLTDAGLSSLAGLENLTHLNLQATGVIDSGIEPLKDLTKMEQLSIHDNPQLGDGGLKHLARMNELKYLDLRGTQVGDTGLQHLKQLPHLVEIVLLQTNVSDRGLESLAEYRKLSSLQLQNTLVTDAGLDHLSQLSTLHFLFLNDTKVTEAGVKKLAAALPQCRIEWDGGVIEPTMSDDPERRAAEWALRLGGTVQIVADGVPRDLTGATAVDQLPSRPFRVRNLSLYSLRQVDDRELAAVRGLKELRMLNLGETSVTNDGLEHVSGLRTLEELVLNGTTVTDEGMRHLVPLERLNRLFFYGSKLTDEGLKTLGQIKSLRELLLDGSRQITDAGVEHLAGLTELQALIVHSTQVTDKSLPVLGRMKQLRFLSLANLKVKDDGVRYLAGLPLHHLDLAKTRVTDEGLSFLKDQRKLKVLYLWDTAVTDQTLDWLIEAGSVEDLRVTRTRITQDGVRRLRTLKTLKGLHVSESVVTPELLRELRQTHPNLNVPVDEWTVEREAAVWALCVNGTVVIQHPDAGPETLTRLDKLPDGDFRLIALRLNGPASIHDEALWNLYDGTYVSLQELALNGTSLRGLWLVAELKTLRRLELRDTKADDEGLGNLRSLTALEELVLTGTAVTETGVQKLAAALPKCRIEWDGGVIEPTMSDDPDRAAAEWVLSAGGTINIVSDGREQRVKSLDDLPDTPIILAGIHLEGRPGVTNEDLTRFRDSKNLTHVHLGAMPLGDAGLENFRNCTDLKNLYLSGTNVTDAGLAHFRDCRLLESLMLRSTRITDAGLAHFQDCEHLAALYLGNTAVSDAGLELLGPQQHLVDLDLSGTRISDEGLLRFQQGTALKAVFLDGTGITNAVLELLERMPHLVGVQVRKTDVTAAGVQKLAAALPRCRIEWDGGEIEPQVDVNQPIELELPHHKGKPFPTRTAATWELGPKENVLPGLIPRPAKLDGVARWQIETIAPRGKVGPIAMSPDHKYVACVLEALSTLSLPCTVRLYDAETGDLAGLFPHPSGVGSISWHPDSRQFATGGVDGQVRVWTTEGQRGAEWPAHKDRVHVAWSPDGKWLATRTESEDREAKLWDVDGKSIADLAGPALKITVLAWSPDSQWLAVGDDKGKVQLWKPDGTKGPGYQTDMRSIDSIAWRPDGQQFAFGGFQDLYAEFTHLYLAGTGGEPPQMINIKRRLITLLSWSPDGQIIGASYFDSFGLWNVEGTPVRQLEDTEGIAETGGRFPVTSLTWNPDGQHVITNRGQVWGADGTLKNTIWDNGAFAGWTRDGQKLVGVSPNHGVVKCGLDGTTSVDNKGEPWLQPGPIASWHARSPAFVAGPSNGFRWWTLDGRPAPVMASGADFSPIAPGVPGVLCSPGGHRILTAYGNFVALRDRHKPIRYQNFPVGILPERSSWSPDGKRMALGSNDGAAIVTFDSPEIVTLGEMPREVVDVAWSPDGQWIATAEDNFVRLWKPDGTPGNLLEFPSKIMVVRWHPNSRELAVEPMYGHTNFEVREIDGTPKLSLRSPLMHGLLRSSWSRDGKLLVAGNHWEQFPGTHLAAWNMDDGEVAWHAPLKPHHARQLRKLEWSADDQHLLTQSDDGIFGVWSGRGELQWLIACPNERDSFSFDAAGQLLHGDPAQLDGWFRCLIEGEDGTFATLKPSEFAQRFAEFVMPGSWPEEGKPTDPERKAATRLLEIGCELGVYVGGVGRTVKKVDELPRERFSVWVIKGPLTDADLVWLHKNRQTFEELFSLYLSGGSNTDQGLKLLRDFPNLWQLEAGHAEKIGPGLEIPQVTCLSGTFPKATAATIQHLKVISDLLELQLRGANVTDDMIDELTQLHTVRTLDLRGLQIAPDSVAKLKAALPLCTVRWP